jgi:sugar-specific transcriptional regulator TrmB
MNIAILQEHLKKFNLNSEEAAVYINLLKLGEASVSDLATAAHLKRPATYNYVDALIKKGLVSWKEGSRGKKVEAQDPINLSQYVDQVKNSFYSLQSVYNEIVPELKSLQAKKDFSTQVKYYEGVKGLRQMVTNTLQAEEKIYGYSYYRRNDVLGLEFMKEFREKWVKAKLKDHVIVNDSNINKKFPKQVLVKEYLKYHELRMLPAETFYISSDIMIYNNVYAVANLDVNNPIGVEIINEEITKTQLSIFNILWKIAKPAEWQK